MKTKWCNHITKYKNRWAGFFGVNCDWFKFCPVCGQVRPDAPTKEVVRLGSLFPSLRFDSYEHYLEWQKGKSTPIPVHVKKGNRMLPNPAYENAQIEMSYIYMGKENFFKTKTK